MGAKASAVKRSEEKVRQRFAVIGGAVGFALASGAVATVSAAAASLLVESTLLKRMLWVVVALVIAVSAGVWRAGSSVTASQPGHDPLPYGPRAGSPR